LESLVEGMVAENPDGQHKRKPQAQTATLWQPTRLSAPIRYSGLSSVFSALSVVQFRIPEPASIGVHLRLEEVLPRCARSVVVVDFRPGLESRAVVIRTATFRPAL
jgi:hypothetical protein